MRSTGFGTSKPCVQFGLGGVRNECRHHCLPGQRWSSDLMLNITVLNEVELGYSSMEPSGPLR
jgi:hypothetical protein